MGSIGVKQRHRELSGRGVRVLTIRRRYVGRAKYLRDHMPFRLDIENRRATWDAERPEFAIGGPSIPSVDLVWRPGAPFLPPRLTAAMEASHDVLSGKRPRPKDDDSVEGRSTLAYWEWRQFLAAICADWWPARYFPLNHYSDHLAARFVSACVLCFPEYLPDEAEEEWIGTPTMQAYGIPAHLERMVPPWNMAHLQVWGEVLMDQLNDAAEARQVLTPESLAEMWNIAEEAGRMAKLASREEFRDQDYPLGPARAGVHWVVPLFSGMTRDDLKHGTAQLMNDLHFHYGEHMLREDARRLFREGRNAHDIAGLMGVSDSQVGLWIKDLRESAR